MDAPQHNHFLRGIKSQEGGRSSMRAGELEDSSVSRDSQLCEEWGEDVAGRLESAEFCCWPLSSEDLTPRKLSLLARMVTCR